MQLSSSESVEQTSDDKITPGTRSRKKHKKLDAICEKSYTRSHSRVAFGAGLKKADLLEDNGEENDTEVRRSSRVRKAPVLLDASPTPAKKRRRVENKDVLSSMDKGKRVVRVKAESLFSSTSNVEADFTGWHTRLRSRGSHVSFKQRDNGGSSMNSGKEVFRNSKGVKEEWGFGREETEDRIEELAQEDLTVGKSKRCKVLLETEDTDSVSDGNIEDEKEVLAEIAISRSEENLLVSEAKDKLVNGIGSKDVLESSSLSEHCHRNDITEIVEDNCQLKKDTHGQNKTIDNLDGKKILEVVSGSLSEDIYRAEAEAEAEAENENENENVDDKLKKHSHQTGKDQSNSVDLDRAMEDVSLAKNGVKPMEDGISETFEKNTVGLDGKVRSANMKEGRHCALCGGYSNGKPPKKLLQDVNGSDKEESSGGSTFEEPGYDVCDGFGDEPGWLGRLLGPINDRYGIAGIWVHQQCAVWSPEVYFSGLGCLKNVRAALWRGRVLKCSRCGRSGATIGCRVDRCPRTYHLPCARATGSIFDHRKFLIACNDHRHLFQPHGIHNLRRLKKLKERKVKFDLRKTSNEALRKDIEAEEKLLENCGEDEEFVKRESKRLQRDLLRIAPTYIGGGNNCESGTQYNGWESIAGLHDVIQCMKEVVFMPLLYPEFFSNLGITPPRGVLLHGYPGTGKTLVVRALIGSCARGDKRIAYFARKGADILGKYVGDAERQLRLLFQVAEKSQPSIIFFDEIDGLAPCRSRYQDQTHSSVVSTLLALMDGLKSRGSVVVIGATNRPDSVDPALRRPGRFDREIYFPLPSAHDREAILSLHTKKWPKPISGSLLRLVARKTVGFAGADLQALCTQAAMIALRRSFPLKELLSGSGERALASKQHPLLSSFTVEEKDWLDALAHSPPPCSRRDVGIAVNDVVSSPLASHLVPFLLRPLSELLVSLYLDERVWLPPSLTKSAIVIKNAIVSALMRRGENSDSWWLTLHDFLLKPETLHDIEDNLRRETILTEDAVGGDVEDDDEYIKYNKPSNLQRIGGYHHGLPNESGRKSGFRILIAGKPSFGQRHLASCLLHCFSGNVEMRKLDLATMSQEGQGDMVQGLTQILMRCSSLSPCVVFLPRMDLWAVETKDGSSCNGKKSGQLQGSSETQSSYLWSSFMEQAESIGITTSVMILATSDMPFEDLPSRVSEFFRCETLKSGLSTSLKAAVPRFIVQLDGNMSNETVLDISATKVSNNLVQFYIQLINIGAHDKSSSSTIEDIIRDDAVLPRSSDSVSDVTKTSVGKHHTVINPVKGKYNLMLAISTFGYQILCYPHFAEICWVTSKLKEGPFTDINGPWKRWPFNSCIARPVNSVTTAEACSSSSSSKDKNKEKSYVVRGLVAIGLSAYKGEYISIREVSLQVRKVLELLVGRINSKIQAGKNKYMFFHVLSQVASFDDLVTSWSYALRSLEADGLSSLDENPGLPCQRSPSSHDNEDIQCKQNNRHETEALDLNKPQGIQSNETRTRALLVDLDLNVPIKDGTEDDFQLNKAASENGVEKCSDDIAKDSGLFSVYHCCSKCLADLRNVIINHLETEIMGDNVTIEGFHDLVTTLSAKLQSEVRKFVVTNAETKSKKVCKCLSKLSKEGIVMPMECECHLRTRNRTIEPNLELTISFKDGVMKNLEDTDANTRFGTKFMSLCLCSLVNWLVTRCL